MSGCLQKYHLYIMHPQIGVEWIKFVPSLQKNRKQYCISLQNIPTLLSSIISHWATFFTQNLKVCMFNRQFLILCLPLLIKEIIFYLKLSFSSLTCWLCSWNSSEYCIEKKGLFTLGKWNCPVLVSAEWGRVPIRVHTDTNASCRPPKPYPHW